MILSTPVALPLLKPDDIDKWRALFAEHAQPLLKTGQSPNAYAGGWVGFDAFASPMFRPVYKAVKVDLERLYPQVWNDVWRDLPPRITGIRFVQSTGAFPPHVDNHSLSWQLRCLFDCDNSADHWYYTKLDNTEPRDLVLPPETTWFAYCDGGLKHGTRLLEGRPKVLLQVFSLGDGFSELVQKSIPQFDRKYLVDYE